MFIDTKIELHFGNCYDILPTLGTESIDALITDPPYEIEPGAAFVRNGTETIDDGVGSHNNADGYSWLNELSCLKRGGNLAIFHKKGFELVSEEIDFWHRFYIVKQNPPPTPRPVFVSSVEECEIGSRKGGKKTWNGGGYTPNYWFGSTTRKETNHPAEKPLEAMLILVNSLTLPGDTILDPFMGSGTTCIACIITGRNFVGIEKDEMYFREAKERINKMRSQNRMDFGVK